MSENAKEIIESFIYEYPVCEIHHIETEDLIITEEARQMCANEVRVNIPGYYYPPALDTLEECLERIHHYKHGFLYSTIAEVNDAQDFIGCTETRKTHERMSQKIQDRFREHFSEVMTLSTGCAICDECHCAEGDCLHPEDRIHTIESHGIMIMRTLVDVGMTYDYGNKVATYFTLVLYND